MLPSHVMFLALQQHAAKLHLWFCCGLALCLRMQGAIQALGKVNKQINVEKDILVSSFGSSWK